MPYVSWGEASHAEGFVLLDYEYYSSVKTRWQHICPLLLTKLPNESDGTCIVSSYFTNVYYGIRYLRSVPIKSDAVRRERLIKSAMLYTQTHLAPAKEKKDGHSRLTEVKNPKISNILIGVWTNKSHAKIILNGWFIYIQKLHRSRFVNSLDFRTFRLCCTPHIH